VNDMTEDDLPPIVAVAPCRLATGFGA
jgi:hypothetical protein